MKESVVRPSLVRLSTFSNDITSEAEKQILFILHIYHLEVEGTNNFVCFFCSGRIRTLVAMATYNSNRLIMGKEEIDKKNLSQWRYLDFFTEMFIE